MKNIIISFVIAGLSLFGATAANAHGFASRVYISGYQSCGTPIYKERYFIGYDRCGRQIWGTRLVARRYAPVVVPRYVAPCRYTVVRPAPCARYYPGIQVRASFRL